MEGFAIFLIGVFWISSAIICGRLGQMVQGTFGDIVGWAIFGLILPPIAVPVAILFYIESRATQSFLHQQLVENRLEEIRQLIEQNR